MREFKKEDYYGLGGAECCSDGRGPWIGDISVADGDPEMIGLQLVVAGKMGNGVDDKKDHVSVIGCKEEHGFDEMTLELPTPELALWVAIQLEAAGEKDGPFELKYLEALGFKKVC